MPAIAMTARPTASTEGLRTFGMFALMVGAMMVPLTIGALRVTAPRSLWARRNRAVAAYLVGFVTVWALAGAVLSDLFELLNQNLAVPEPEGTGVALAIASIFQLTSIKRRALNGHHRTRPLAPQGLAAHFDCFRYGVDGGTQCLLSCGPMMAAMVLNMTALLLIPVSAIVIVERYRYRPPTRMTAVALGLTAVVVVAT
jgi:predicted metal-binding membrane protein